MGIGLSDKATYQIINTRTGGIVTAGTITYNNFKEEENMDERLNKYLERNAIEVDGNGNFEMYVVVDADDKDHEVGSIFHGKETEVYAEKRAYEDLKEDNNRSAFSLNYLSTYTFTFDSLRTTSSIEMKKKTTIREDLITLEDRMFKVSVNKENVIDVIGNTVYVNKYKVLEEIKLQPVLKFKIQSIDKDKISVVLYNSVTEKSKTVSINCSTTVDSLDDVKGLINAYLKENDNQVRLMNSIIDNGLEL